MTLFRADELIEALCREKVEFIVIGGVAATIHGLDRYTSDLDVIYRRTPENIQRVADAMEPLNPSLRGAPEGLPFRFDAETIVRGLNFTLSSAAGAIDFLATAPAATDYEELFDHSEPVTLCGCEVRVVNLDRLIEMKRGAGRVKDFEMIAMLEELQQPSSDPSEPAS